MSSKATSAHNAEAGTNPDLVKAKLPKAKAKKHHVIPLKPSPEIMKTRSKTKAGSSSTTKETKTVPALQDISNPMVASFGSNSISQESSVTPKVVKKRSAKHKSKQTDANQEVNTSMKTEIKISPKTLASSSVQTGTKPPRHHSRPTKMGPALRRVIESGSSNNDSSQNILGEVKPSRPRRARRSVENSGQVKLEDKTVIVPEPTIRQRPAHNPAVKPKIIHRKTTEVLARNKPRVIAGMMDAPIVTIDNVCGNVTESSKPKAQQYNATALYDAYSKSHKTQLENVKGKPVNINVQPVGNAKAAKHRPTSDMAKSIASKSRIASPIPSTRTLFPQESMSKLATEVATATSFKNLIKNIGAMSTFNAEPAVERSIDNSLPRPVIPLHKSSKVQSKIAVTVSADEAKESKDKVEDGRPNSLSANLTKPQPRVGYRKFPKVSVAPSSKFHSITEVPNW